MRLVESQPNPLFAWASSAPARSRSEIESRFNRVAVSFRSNLDLGQFLQIEPLATIWCVAGKWNWTENAFPHDFIIARRQRLDRLSNHVRFFTKADGHHRSGPTGSIEAQFRPYSHLRLAGLVLGSNPVTRAATASVRRSAPSRSPLHLRG